MTNADPAWWGLHRDRGALAHGRHRLDALADEHGTPLYVMCAPTLRERCRELARAFGRYAGGVSVHFSYKTCPVAGVLKTLHSEGVGAEVVDGYELWLARRLGVPDSDIVMNGPNKTDDEIRDAHGIGLFVLDGMDEIERLGRSAAPVSVALRICPDVVPRGMNSSSVTGSRKNQFGVDLADVPLVLKRIAAHPHLRFRGIQAHIGSGIHDVSAFRREADVALDAQKTAFELGLRPDVLDLGGGLGTRFSREMTTFELLAYLAIGRLPKNVRPAPSDLFARYGEALTDAVTRGCKARSLPLPRLLIEPGRALVSDAGILLLRVGAVRERKGIGNFAIADGGAMTVSMMFLSELHHVLLANRDAEPDGRCHVFGRLPSPMDVVYRNLPTPRLVRGDLLAVMDAGAYFVSTSTNFGGPRPPVVLLDEVATVVRRRETYEDLFSREQVP